MNRAKRLSIQLTTTAGLALLLFFGVPTIVDRRDYTAAVSQMLKNPSPENEAVLRREEAKNRHLAFVVNASAAGIIFLLMNAGWLLVTRLSSIWRKETHSGL
jgi:hypothetical protein